MEGNWLKQSEPINALKAGLEKRSIKYLKKHGGFRKVVGIFGVLFFTLGIVCILFWDFGVIVLSDEGNLPPSFISGYQLAVPTCGGGVLLLRIWQLSKSASIRFDRILRILLILVSFIPLLIGVVTFYTQDLYGLNWTKPVVVPSFVSGFTALGIWYLSGKKKLKVFGVKPDLMGQLKQLKEMEESGFVSESESQKIKLKLIELD